MFEKTREELNAIWTATKPGQETPEAICAMDELARRARAGRKR